MSRDAMKKRNNFGAFNRKNGPLGSVLSIDE
jgi:hypothetical protein